MVKRVALVFGIVFLLIGILGLMQAGGREMGADPAPHVLLGLFPVNLLHNIVHLLFGIAGLVMARTAAQARNYLVFGGAIYLVLFVYGLIVGQESAANFVPVNTADDFLHLVLGIGMVGLGLVLTRDRSGIAGATS